MASQKGQLRSGLTWVSLLAGLFAIFVFVPGNIYLNLMTGQRIEVSIFAMILFVEMGSMLGRKIARQEAYMISFLAAMGSWVPLDMVYRVYFRNSDIARSFGFADQIPTWWVPPPETQVQVTRTFFDPSWVVPFVIEHLHYPVLVVTLAISVGLLLKELYITEQNLPFPMEQVTAEQVITISEGEKSSADLLFAASVFGIGWGFLVYALPTVVQSYTGRIVRYIPIPYYDFTPQIERFLPGAMFGLVTDLTPIIMAFVLGRSVILSMVAGSLAVWVFGNTLLVRYNLAFDADPTLAGYQPWWVPGMDSAFIYARSTQFFWAVPLMGFVFAAGLMPVFRYPRRFYRALTSASATGIRQSRLKWIIVLGIVLPLIGSITMFAVLTDFPLYLAAPFFILGPIVMSMVNTQIVGETGVNIDVNVPERLIYYGSGYPGVDVWFARTMINVEGTFWVRNFKVAQLTDTPISDQIIGRTILHPIRLVVGYLFVLLFWQMAPIPSGLYPGATIFWRQQAITQAVWIGGRQVGLFSPYLLVGGLAAGAISWLVASTTGLFSVIGVAAGTQMLPHSAMLLLVGLFVKLAIIRRKGQPWWNRNGRLLAAGLAVGVSISVALAVAVSLIMNSIWILPI